MTEHVFKKKLFRVKCVVKFGCYRVLKFLRLYYDFHSLLNFYALYHRDVFLLQVGAFDGIQNDPVHYFIKTYRWRAVLIEPQKEIFKALENNYRGLTHVRLLNAAVMENDGVTRLYKIKQDSLRNAWDEQLASVLDKGGDLAKAHPDSIETEDVACVSFKELFRRYEIQHIDVLQIDTEGYDFEIIKHLDIANTLKPVIIHYEHKHLSGADSAACQAYLISLGYSLIKEHSDTTAFLRDRLRSWVSANA